MDYSKIKQLSPIAYDFINSFNEGQYADGRYELGKGIYVNLDTYQTQFRDSRQYEAHKKYIDIQIMLKGEEIITVAPVSNLIISDEYSEEKDIIFYQNNMNGVDYVISEKSYLVFKPGDGHMPCICIGSPREVRKAVIKIPVNL